MTTFSWFQKFLAIVWIFSLMMISFGSSASVISTSRYIDVTTGILKQEKTAAIIWQQKNTIQGLLTGSVLARAAGPVIIVGDIVKRILLHLFASVLKWILNKISKLIDQALDLIQKYADVLANLSSSLSPIFAALTTARKTDAGVCSQISSFVKNNITPYLSYQPASPIEYGLYNLSKRFAQNPVVAFGGSLFQGSTSLFASVIGNNPKVNAASFVTGSDFKNILNDTIDSSLNDPSLCNRPLQNLNQKYSNIGISNSPTALIPEMTLDSLDVLGNNDVIGVANTEQSQALSNALAQSVTDSKSKQTANGDNFCTASLPLAGLFNGGCDVVVTGNAKVKTDLAGIAAATASVTAPHRDSLTKINQGTDFTTIISQDPCKNNQLQDAIPSDNPQQLNISTIANATPISTKSDSAWYNPIFGSVPVVAADTGSSVGTRISTCLVPKFTQKDVSTERLKTAANAITGPNAAGEGDTSLNGILNSFWQQLQDLVNKGIKRLTDILNNTINKVVGSLNLSQLDFSNIFGLLGAGSSIIDKNLSKDLNDTYNSFNGTPEQGNISAQMYPNGEGGFPSDDTNATNLIGYQFIRDRGLTFTFTPQVTTTNTDYKITQIKGQNISPGNTVTINISPNDLGFDYVKSLQVKLENDGKTLTATRGDNGWIQTAAFDYTAANTKNPQNTDTQEIKLVWFKD